MAIGPLTTKVLAKIALQAATDEETRKNVFVAILVPIIVVLLILTTFAYILNSPFSFIMNLLKNDRSKIAIKECKAKYSDTIRLQKGIIVLNGRYPLPAIGEIIIPYGMHVDPIDGRYIMHTGIDIEPAWHSPIISVADGQIVKIGIDNVYGNYIVIRHELSDEEFYSVYAHLSTIYVLPDQEIEQGDIIGLEGGDPIKDILPGVSTGHHLHFEIRTNMDPSTHVDPKPYLYTDTHEIEEGTQIEEKIVD